MRPTTRRALNVASGLLIAAMIGCFAAAGWFDHRQYALSGVPVDHYAVNENGRQFYVHRGGPPIDQRPQVPITAEQYRLWEENHHSSSRWGGLGVLCIFALGLVAWVRIAGPGPAGRPAPGGDAGPAGGR